MNGADMQTKLADPKGRITALLKASPDPGRQVKGLFLATLSRLPTERERLRGIAWLAASYRPPQSRRRPALGDR